MTTKAIPQDASPSQDNYDEIDWENDARVVVHDQAATAAFLTDAGALFIWQSDSFGEEARVIISPEAIEPFLQALADITEIPRRHPITGFSTPEEFVENHRAAGKADAYREMEEEEVRREQEWEEERQRAKAQQEQDAQKELKRVGKRRSS